MNKSYAHCDFSKWFIDYLKNAYEIKLYVCCCWYRIHISGLSTIQNQNLWSAYMYIYCHAEVSNLQISADRASLNFVENSAISRNRTDLLHFGSITAMIEISQCFFPVYTPPCVISCVIPKIIILCLPYTLIGNIFEKSHEHDILLPLSIMGV